MTLSKSSIAVVGGSGFIGTRLVQRLLAAGRSVRIVDVARSQTFGELTQLCDVRDATALKSALTDVDVVYNLSAEHRDDVKPTRLYDEVNVGGAHNVCRAASEAGVRQLIFTSSVAVYGEQSGRPDEQTTPRPCHDYGRTKSQAEQVYRGWAASRRDRSLVIIRPTVVFGEGNRGNVYNLMRQIAAGRFLMIGDGGNRKSMAYVENVAALLQFATRFGSGEHLYNYADEPDYDMKTLVETIRGRLGMERSTPPRVPYALGHAVGMLCDIAAGVSRRRFPVSVARVKKFVTETRFDSTKIRQAGFQPQVSLEQGLDRMIAAEFGGGATARRTAA